MQSVGTLSIYHLWKCLMLMFGSPGSSPVCFMLSCMEYMSIYHHVVHIGVNRNQPEVQILSSIDCAHFQLSQSAQLGQRLHS